MAEIPAHELDNATFVDQFLPFKLFPAGHVYKFKNTRELRDSLTKDNIPSYLKTIFADAIVEEPRKLPDKDALLQYNEYMLPNFLPAEVNDNMDMDDGAKEFEEFDISTNKDYMPGPGGRKKLENSKKAKFAL